MENIINEKRSSFSLWIQAIRPFSLTATIIPVIFGAMFTLAYYPGEINWLLMIVVALGSPFFQLSGNLLSEYYDYKKNVDRKETFGSSRVLVDNLLSPKSVFVAGFIAIIILFCFGSVLIAFRGIDMLVIGLIGILGSYFYSGLKYRAFGDLQIYLSFGPLMIFGTHFALTGSYLLMWDLFILSIPIGFLVVAILHANNTRDIMHDGEANIKTFASVIGVKASISYYNFLLLGAYLSVIIFVLLGKLPYWSLVVILSFPIAIRNIKIMSTAKVHEPQNIVMLDVMTAQLHMLFGLLLSISLLVKAILW